MYGYQGKMLFADLSTGVLEDRPLDEKTAKAYLGGPALGAKVLYENMPANADAFGPESMVGFVTGPLNDTGALTGGRYTVVSKSPVTGGWNDANSGGYFGPALKKAGYDAVFVKGISEKPVYIYIEDGKAEIKDASELWGLTTIATEEKLREIHGDKTRAALIGPAGEKKAYLAAVMNDEHRAAGRGGTGAVIGSKNLKAIVVNGNCKTEIADKEKLLDTNKALADFYKGPGAMVKDMMGVYGTGVLFSGSCMSGDAGIKNWSGSGVADYPESQSDLVGSMNIHKYVTKAYHCSACPIGCGALMSVKSERWKDLEHTSRPEYETMGSFGSMLLNSDYESVLECNQLCNEYGTDTISTGSTVAWAMECYNKGILSLEELDGIDLKWGDGDAIVAITEKILKGEGVGAVLANGSQYAADHFGKGHECLVVANGIEAPMHDSLFNRGLTRTYKYDPTPARHVKGGTGLLPAVLGDDFDYDGHPAIDLDCVIGQEIVNASGACLIPSAPKPMLYDMIRSVTGFEYTDEEINTLGKRMYTIRHAFNLREGMTRKDFKMSKRLYEAYEDLTGPMKGIKVDHERLADGFFNLLDWDLESLVPSKEALENIGELEAVIEEIYA